MKLTDEIGTLKGIGPKSTALYARLGIFTVRDLLTYYPRDYERYEKPVPFLCGDVGNVISVYAKITSAPSIAHISGMTVVTCKLADDRGTPFLARWYNQPYLRASLKTGTACILRGKLVLKRSGKFLEQPQIYSREQYQELSKKLLPIYPLTKGLTRAALMKSIKQVLNSLYEISEQEGLTELPADVERKYKLIAYRRALEEIHFPANEDAFLRARERIVFEEFFVFFVNIYELKSRMCRQSNAYPVVIKPETDALIRNLSFSLTSAQQDALQTIRREMSGPGVMHRLLQGDVGSGKTIVAFLSMYEAALNGYQAALMAPTEVLAVQHFHEFQELMKRQEQPVRATLLVGSLTVAQKREAMAEIAAHTTDVVIGTHALFQDKVLFQELALVITDEQHRFGVNQRQMLSDKGGLPHALFMSATPIPRSLAGVLYADMDVSIIGEKPGNRLPIKSCVVGPEFHPNAYAFIRRELDKGHQAYVICPLVEESELMSGENVIDYAGKMRGIFGSENVGILHGRMSADEKRKAMLDFSKAKTKILVSTTVVEVGVDVPNATVMLIEDAQRFGLAQLHQLRGRVGRGTEQSYCIFVDTDGKPEDNERLKVMNTSEDGFFIASEDLRLRGPGDLFGIRQSGELNFKLADIYRDGEWMTKAASEAARYRCKT